MSTTIKWKKGIFETCAKIMSEGEPIGKMKDKLFSQDSEGELWEKKYHFKTTGIFKQETDITDAESGQQVGTITYNSWNTKASLVLNGKEYQWKYDNSWQNRWSMSGENVTLTSKNHELSGSIESSIEDPLVVLSGLFVTNFYRQLMVMIMLVSMMPIWMILL